jgi:uncharacterized protein
MLAVGIIHHVNFLEIVRHPWFMSAFLAALSAQALKFALAWRRTGRPDGRLFRASGGMPSVHSALVSSLAFAVGLTEGFDAPYAMIAVGLGFIVLVDAATLRREAGEHAKLLNRIVSHLNSASEEDRIEARRLEEKLGHRRREVVAGALWGLFVAFVVCAIWDFWK